MTAKEKAIQEAYGEAWEKVKSYADSDGWITREVTRRDATNGIEPENFGYGIHEVDMIDFSGDGYYRWRPISLRGIDHNNGWIRCDNPFLCPPDESKVHVYQSGKYWGIMKTGVFKKICNKPGCEDFTHWKLVEEVKPPIY